MKILNSKQGSHRWLQSRLGRPSASNFDKLITTTGNPSSSAEQYINRLIAEKLTEPEAKMYFEMSHPVTCGETGFILDDSGDFGCSPDLVIYDSTEDTIIGGCEIKVPLDHTHVANMRRQLMPKKYYQQVQGCIKETGYNVLFDNQIQTGSISGPQTQKNLMAKNTTVLLSRVQQKKRETMVYSYRYWVMLQLWG